VLESISPTRFALLRVCPLHVAFDVGHAGRRRLGRPSPAAIPGIAAHAALQTLVESGLLTSDSLEEEAAKAWISALCGVLGIEATERDLARIVPPFYLFGERIVNVARTLAQLTADSDCETEVDLASRDGLLTGTADLVVTTRSGEVWIADYKSRLHDPTTNPRVSDEYSQQLRLYSFMLHEQRSQWALRALLIPLDGKPVEVSVDPETCQSVANAAAEALRQFQSTALSDQPAHPSPTACRFCPHTAPCPAFAQSLDESWAQQVLACVGEVIAVETSTQGGTAIRIAVEAGSLDSSDVWLVRVSQNLLPRGAPPRLGARIAATGLSQAGQIGTYTVRQLSVLSVADG
jgi:RecB family exonuclease